MLIFSNNAPKLKPKHRDAINTCVQSLLDATDAFIREPSRATFAAFNDVSVAKIKAMETALSHQPMIWKMLKPICNAMILIMNAIKKMIWTNPKQHSLFNSKSEAQLAWEWTHLRYVIMHRLEDIRLVVECAAGPTPN
jgi:formylmethanofuran dehydrogenase subunit E-like metal-binding protein